MGTLDDILGPVRSGFAGVARNWKRAMLATVGLTGLIYGSANAADAGARGTNNPPNNNTIALSIGQNGSADVALPGTTDPDGDALHLYSMVKMPANSTLLIQANTITVTPNTDYLGADSFQYKVADPSNATGTVTVNITVYQRNQPPNFTINSTTSYSLLEGDPAVSVPNWATITPGPASESSQIVTLTTSANNPALFQNSVLPTLTSTDGTTYNLNFTPAAFGTGTTTVTFKAQDDGGTANNGNDTTIKTMTVTIAARPVDPGSGGTTPVDPIVNTKTTWEIAGNQLNEDPVKGQAVFNGDTLRAVIESAFADYAAKSTLTGWSFKYKYAKVATDSTDKPDAGVKTPKIKSNGSAACLELFDSPGDFILPYYVVDEAGRQFMLANTLDGTLTRHGIAILLPTIDSYATLDAKSGAAGPLKSEALRTIKKASYGNDRLNPGYAAGKISFDKMAKGSTPRKLVWTPSVVVPPPLDSGTAYPTPQSRQHYVSTFTESITLAPIGSSGVTVVPLASFYAEYINRYGRDWQLMQTDTGAPIDVANIAPFIDSATPTSGFQLIRPIRTNEELKADLSAKIANYSIKWGKGTAPTATPVLLVRNPDTGKYIFTLGLELQPGTIPKGTTMTYDIQLQATPNKPPQ